MIMDSNTIVNPGTVMVETFYASVTNCTVFASWSAKNLTIGTHLAGVNFGENIHKRVLGSYDTGIPRAGNKKCCRKHDRK